MQADTAPEGATEPKDATDRGCRLGPGGPTLAPFIRHECASGNRSSGIRRLSSAGKTTKATTEGELHKLQQKTELQGPRHERREAALSEVPSQHSHEETDLAATKSISASLQSAKGRSGRSRQNVVSEITCVRMKNILEVQDRHDETAHARTRATLASYNAFADTLGINSRACVVRGYALRQHPAGHFRAGSIREAFCWQGAHDAL
eukprot:1196093-Prorocentrum_minimum.AAC.2